MYVTTWPHQVSDLHLLQSLCSLLLPSELPLGFLYNSHLVARFCFQNAAYNAFIPYTTSTSTQMRILTLKELKATCQLFRLITYLILSMEGNTQKDETWSLASRNLQSCTVV